MKNDKATIKGFKGFNMDWTCNKFQFAPGQEYEHKGEVKSCESGFHFCENPLDVFGYYPPGTSRFAEVEGSGETSKEHNGDSKVAVSHLKIGAEFSLHSYIEAAINFVFEKATKMSLTENKEEKKMASNSAKEGCSVVMGIEGKAKSSIGGWITVCEWSAKGGEWHRINMKTAKVDGKRIKADTFYTLKGGKFVEVK